MERILGKSILHHIHEKGPVKNEDGARHIMRAVLSGIGYMHELGVVHRDMNPTNVFISEV
jgi:serine/threonine protein kinase